MAAPSEEDGSKGQFEGFRMAWLLRVALDRKLPRDAARVAVMIAGSLDEKTGSARLGPADAHALLGMSGAILATSLRCLFYGGHIAADYEKTAVGRVGVYRPTGIDDVVAEMAAKQPGVPVLIAPPPRPRSKCKICGDTIV